MNKFKSRKIVENGKAVKSNTLCHLSIYINSKKVSDFPNAMDLKVTTYG